MIYDSRAIPLSEWQEEKQNFLSWEYVINEKEKIVYLRKHLSGERNPSPGWKEVENV